MSDSIEYIRDYYGVPARVGGRIRYTGDPAGPVGGTITGAQGPHLLVRFDDAPGESVLHPTWELEYIEADALPDGVLVTPIGKLVVEW